MTYAKNRERAGALPGFGFRRGSVYDLRQVHYERPLAFGVVLTQLPKVVRSTCEEYMKTIPLYVVWIAGRAVVVWQDIEGDSDDDIPELEEQVGGDDSAEASD